jgi:hypothetical protein
MINLEKNTITTEKENNKMTYKIILTEMYPDPEIKPKKEEITTAYELTTREQAEIYMLHIMNDELSLFNKPDIDNTPHNSVFIADLDGEHDAIIRMWDGDDYWDVSYYDIVTENTNSTEKRKIKYSEMIKFLNDNGILLLQPVIADTVDVLLPLGCDMTEEEYEEICDCVFDGYLDKADDATLDDIWDLAEEELVKRNIKEEL